jgi:cytochrome P450
MFFAALINTVRWLVFDQRKLLAAGFGTIRTSRSRCAAKSSSAFNRIPCAYLAADSTLLARYVFEGMRLHLALPIVIRQATGDFALGDKTAHQNDYIVLAVEEMHWRHFGQDGLEFRPGRFGTKADLPKTATFGGGTKTCPGRAIAVQEVRTVCALIVSSFNIRLDKATDPRVGRNRISATPRGGMVLSLDRITA